MLMLWIGLGKKKKKLVRVWRIFSFVATHIAGKRLYISLKISSGLSLQSVKQYF